MLIYAVKCNFWKDQQFSAKKNPVVLRNSKRNVGVCYPYLSISGSNYFMQQSVLAEGQVYMIWYEDDGSTRLFPIANYVKEQLCSMEEILSKIRQWHMLQKHLSSSRRFFGFFFFVVHQQSVVWGVFYFPNLNAGYFETFNFINMYFMYIIAKIFIAKFPYMYIMCYD